MLGLRNRVSVHISSFAFLIGALLILVLPVKWLVAAMLAAVWHEMCHCMAVQISGGQIHRISIGVTGAVMQSEILDTVTGLLCILAGPFGGALPIFLIHWFPRLAICAMVYSLYNLLPIYPLDGGRALQSLAQIVCLPKWILKMVEQGVVVFIFCFSLYASLVLKLGLFPLLISVIVLMRTKSAKTLAN